MEFDAKTIVFDVETTGLTAWSDEILQISIINGLGETIFNQYIKPSRKKAWPDAQRIHGISPESVQDCKTVDFYRGELQKIFNGADILIAYNGRFDRSFLHAAGIICLHPGVHVLDPMLDFANVYGEFDDYHEEPKWQKLVTAAEYYDFGEFGAHDSLCDVAATLHVAKRMYGHDLQYDDCVLICQENGSLVNQK